MSQKVQKVINGLRLDWFGLYERNNQALLIVESDPIDITIDIKIAYLLRRRTIPKPARPKPSKPREEGSGTSTVSTVACSE